LLRYFGTKEDAVLDAVDAQGGRIADALRARPAGEDDWTALRHALGTVVEHHRQDPAGALALSRLIMKTPALCTRSMEKQNGWRPVIAEALAERAAPSRPTALGPLVRAAAAVDCLNIAVDHWTASDGTLDLDDLIDEAFGALAPH
jgi:AcrR family transcriptional regulator